MTDSAIVAERGRRVLSKAPQVAVVLIAAAAVLLLLVPFGWRFGLWSFRLSFQMVAWAQDLALAAGVVAAIALLLGRTTIGAGWRWPMAALILLGLLVVYVPWQWAQLRGPRPPINDITTDTANPPPFVAALPARAAEQAVAVVYGGAMIAQQQAAAYPDIAPATLPLPPAQGFERALAAARAMRGWTILASDGKTGIIEASDTTLYFGFTDDIVIRVTPEGAGSRVDIRSHSRQGRGDLGVNAARVRKYLVALKG
ncbi:MAG TPA: DUF1499 domain-containing protein [Stellaceae bacterium]|jgi:uncharacterized protein (DUF1499 family)|nr:DUF1499 domain-containing protein [Stellaceae bacterium]